MRLSSFAHSEVGGGTQFVLAAPEDDGAICRFLAKQSMTGKGMSVVTRTEPSFFAAAAMMGDEPQVMVAKRAGAIVGLGVRTTRRVWLNGEVVRVGHLSYLRLGEAVRRQRDFLRAGYGFLRELQRADPVPFHLTAILDDNVAAKRLLEAGLPGLPRYVALAKVSTFTFDARRLGARGVWATGGGAEEMISRARRERPLTPVAAGVEDVVRVVEDDAVVAVGGTWDQRGVRQVVMTNAPRWMRVARPVINLVRRQKIPPLDVAIRVGFVSRLTVLREDAGSLQSLLEMLAAKARSQGIDYLAMSLAAENPLCAAALPLSAHVTRSTLYAVSWDGDAGCPALTTYPYVEAALL